MRPNHDSAMDRFDCLARLIARRKDHDFVVLRARERPRRTSDEVETQRLRIVAA